MAYYLVQRLTMKPRNIQNRSGFDGHFALQYMGSSEFEWGAIPKALKRMREHEVASNSIEVNLDGVTRIVHFVGNPSSLQDAASAMEEWSKSDKYRPSFWGKESTGFPDQFAGRPTHYDDTNAWWAIDTDVAFALSSEVADRLVQAFNDRPADV